MESTLRRTWAEIDLDALAHNYETLRRRIGAGVKFLGVVKADAYGHGAVRVAQTLQEQGAAYLAVTTSRRLRPVRPRHWSTARRPCAAAERLRYISRSIPACRGWVS